MYDCTIAGADSWAKSSRSSTRSLCSNGAATVSPPDKPSRTWRNSSSPVHYTYRTGWVLPHSPAASRTSTAATTSPQQHHHQFDNSSVVSGPNGKNSNTEDSHDPQTSLLSLSGDPDLSLAVVGQEHCKRFPATFNGHVGMVNGSSITKSEVVSFSSPDKRPGFVNNGRFGPGFGFGDGKCPEKRQGDFFSSPLPISFSSPPDQATKQSGSGDGKRWDSEKHADFSASSTTVRTVCNQTPTSTQRGHPSAVIAVAVLSKSFQRDVETFPPLAEDLQLISNGSKASHDDVSSLELQIQCSSAPAATSESETNESASIVSDHAAGSPRKQLTVPADHSVKPELFDQGERNLA